jgi:hypothetical protein
MNTILFFKVKALHIYIKSSILIPGTYIGKINEGIHKDKCAASL